MKKLKYYPEKFFDVFVRVVVALLSIAAILALLWWANGEEMKEEWRDIKASWNYHKTGRHWK